MAKIRFYLDNQVFTDGRSIIMLDLTFDAKRMRISTGETVPPKFWDAVNQVVKKSCNGSFEINSHLQKMEAELLKIYRDLRLSNIPPTTAIIKEKYKALHQAQVEPEPIGETRDLFKTYDEYIENSKITKGKSAIKGHKVTLNHLKAYENHTGQKLTFESLDINFYDKFIAYFIFKKVTNNTIGSNVKNLKAFCRWAFDRGYYEGLQFKQFKVLAEESEEVYLTQDELDKIAALDLTDNKRLSRVRDLFLLQCYTGLRFSDIVNLKAENIKNGSIKLRAIKTRDNLSIPILPAAQKILEKYTVEPLPVISNQKMNKYIKELAKAAEIVESIEITKYIGVERKTEVFKKHDLISSHTGRRTFITLSLEKGMRPEVIMKITGHKDWRSFRKYTIITEKVKEQEMLLAWQSNKKDVVATP